MWYTVVNPPCSSTVVHGAIGLQCSWGTSAEVSKFYFCCLLTQRNWREENFTRLTLSPQSFPGKSDTFHGNTSYARDSSLLKRGFSSSPDVIILVTRFLLPPLRIIFCLILTKKLNLLLAWWNVDVVLRCLNQRLGYSHICSVLPQPPFKRIICFIKYSTLRKICRMGP